MSAGRRGFPTFGQGVAILFLQALPKVIISVAVWFVAMAASGARSMDTPLPDTARLISLLLGACASAAVVLNWASKARGEPLRLLVLPKPVAPVPLVLALVTTLGALFALAQISAWVRWLIPPWPIFRQAMADLERGSLPLVLAAVVVAAPVCEELVFRGVILRGFLENYGTWPAVLLSSLLFAVMHLNPWQGVTAFFIGCLFAWFVARTGSLLTAIAGHVLANGLAAVSTRLNARIPGTMEGFLPWWLTALGVLVTAAGLLAFNRATRQGA